MHDSTWNPSMIIGPREWIWRDSHLQSKTSVLKPEVDQVDALLPVTSTFRSSPWNELLNMEVSINGGTPQIIDFNRIFHSKPSSYWGTPILRNPHINVVISIGPSSCKASFALSFLQVGQSMWILDTCSTSSISEAVGGPQKMTKLWIQPDPR